jgi:hypothetical protein
MEDDHDEVGEHRISVQDRSAAALEGIPVGEMGKVLVKPYGISDVQRAVASLQTPVQHPVAKQVRHGEHDDARSCDMQSCEQGSRNC